MSQTRIESDLYVTGTISGKAITLPASTVDDTAVKGAAGIQATKLQHQYQHISQPQDSTGTAAVSRKVIHVVRGATGTLVAFETGVIAAAVGAATVTVDLKKNGSSILTATISITSALAAFATTAGTFSSTSVVVGDVLEFHITAVNAGGGTLPQGVFGRLTIREDSN
jgi:hypothetical protein